VAAALVAATWGSVIAVWVAAAAYNAARGPRWRRRTSRVDRSLLAAVVLSAIVGVPLAAFGRHLVVTATWIRVAGLAVLVVSALFTIWARLALGTMWSLGAVIKEKHRLRTHGPYALTRHPIYTGLLGMLLGTTLVARVGAQLALVPAGLVLLALKARGEEQLMLDVFGDEYRRYRESVPRLVPRLSRSGRPRRRRRL
jgi:protein-S-isoprenylcysteine O-methyltransferase Ste14